jgi:hypothetical protein
MLGMLSIIPDILNKNRGIPNANVGIADPAAFCWKQSFD